MNIVIISISMDTRSTFGFYTWETVKYMFRNQNGNNCRQKVKWVRKLVNELETSQNWFLYVLAMNSKTKQVYIALKESSDGLLEKSLDHKGQQGNSESWKNITLVTFWPFVFKLSTIWGWGKWLYYLKPTNSQLFITKCDRAVSNSKPITIKFLMGALNLKKLAYLYW